MTGRWGGGGGGWCEQSRRGGIFKTDVYICKSDDEEERG